LISDVVKFSQYFFSATLRIYLLRNDIANAAIFYDTGFVNVAPWDFSTQDVVSDIGVGLRLDLPIGPLRIDYGWPLQKQRGTGDGGKFNFAVGYQF